MSLFQISLTMTASAVEKTTAAQSTSPQGKQASPAKDGKQASPAKTDRLRLLFSIVYLPVFRIRIRLNNTDPDRIRIRLNNTDPDPKHWYLHHSVRFLYTLIVVLDDLNYFEIKSIFMNCISGLQRKKIWNGIFLQLWCQSGDFYLRAIGFVLLKRPLFISGNFRMFCLSTPNFGIMGSS